MEDYKQYLAQKILTEDQPVTYRLLSRAIKVHVNTAKEMLYEFHRVQNAKRPGTLHATYLVYGTKRKVEQHDGDVEMTDSQKSDEFQVSFSDEVPTYTLSLVREEALQETLAQYSEVTSIQVYSLAQHPLKDLQLLVESARQVLELTAGGNAPASGKTFGTIVNPNVRRRERGSRPVTSASLSAAKTEPKLQLKQEPQPSSSPATKQETKEDSKASAKAPSSAPVKKTTQTASLKRQGSSGGIGQMFAKAAAKPKKPAARATESASNSAAASGAEDTPMSDDGEDDTEPTHAVKKEKAEEKEDEGARRTRDSRRAELQRMMEESDDDEDEQPERPDSPVEEPTEDEPPPPEPELAAKKADEPKEVVSSSGDGRRRGKRRVMKKKQVMDDQGYLVTIQEQDWESFSEEEAPPPAKKEKTAPVKAEPAAKPKKAAGKGQGNIMSFFSKK
ncbi:DNA polymerase subunit Cdc27 [Xylariaceae sp. FL0016]|nr:DNA polymerase subunit Cdc27 [Xylariaceae sp. FL0016]